MFFFVFNISDAVVVGGLEVLSSSQLKDSTWDSECSAVGERSDTHLPSRSPSPAIIDAGAKMLSPASCSSGSSCSSAPVQICSPTTSAVAAEVYYLDFIIYN